MDLTITLLAGTIQKNEFKTLKTLACYCNCTIVPMVYFLILDTLSRMLMLNATPSICDQISFLSQSSSTISLQAIQKIISTKYYRAKNLGQYTSLTSVYVLQLGNNIRTQIFAIAKNSNGKLIRSV